MFSKLWQIAGFNLLILLVVFTGCPVFDSVAKAQSESDEFSIQVAPSLLTGSIKPGETKIFELKIRNNGSQTESLKIELRNFKITGQDNQVTLESDVAAEIKNFVSFSQPVFEISPGEWFTQRITVALPSTAGFSYSFGLLISRQKVAIPTAGSQALQGSVAVFTLINVDRPDAKRRIDVAEFKVSSRFYEYLPATFVITLKNGGNTILQPQGNIYIQRHSNDKEPLAVLKINETGSYILPGVARTMTIDWNNGFPVYENTKNADNTPLTKKLNWDFNQLKNFRLGKYNAKLVAVYDDGQRDIALEGQLTFWVIPWKLLLLPLLLLIILLIGLWAILKKGSGFIKRRKKYEIPRSN